MSVISISIHHETSYEHVNVFVNVLKVFLHRLNCIHIQNNTVCFRLHTILQYVNMKLLCFIDILTAHFTKLTRNDIKFNIFSRMFEIFFCFHHLMKGCMQYWDTIDIFMKRFQFILINSNLLL